MPSDDTQNQQNTGVATPGTAVPSAEPAAPVTGVPGATPPAPVATPEPITIGTPAPVVEKPVVPVEPSKEETPGNTVV